jgi:hypothetical protein
MNDDVAVASAVVVFVDDFADVAVINMFAHI